MKGKLLVVAAVCIGYLGIIRIPVILFHSGHLLEAVFVALLTISYLALSIPTRKDSNYNR